MDVQLSKVSIEKEFTTILMSYIEDDNIKFFNKKIKKINYWNNHKIESYKQILYILNNIELLYKHSIKIFFLVKILKLAQDNKISYVNREFCKNYFICNSRSNIGYGLVKDWSCTKSLFWSSGWIK